MPNNDLSNNLGLRLRINNGIPEWSARGADTWSPFSSTPTITYYSSNLSGDVDKSISITFSKGKHICVISDMQAYLYAGSAKQPSYSVTPLSRKRVFLGNEGYGSGYVEYAIFDFANSTNVTISAIKNGAGYHKNPFVIVCIKL